MDCESLQVDPIIARLLAGGVRMRRDDDYLRDLLAKLEASDEWQHMLGFDDELGGGDQKLDYHVVLLEDEGLLKRLQPGIYRMTAKGHDFLDHTRDSGIWASAKATTAKIGDHSITTLMKVAEGMVMARLREITGLDL